tara:strand:- start:782 stop:1504 length:723 start_codon:yes stop_codon:yes gene_type:complete
MLALYMDFVLFVPKNLWKAKKWLSRNYRCTIVLISHLNYLSYSTGSFGIGKYDGICLQFICEKTGSDYHVFFNAHIRRVRKVGNYQIGSVLSKNRFRVGQRSAFFKFWISTNLPLPPRLAAFSDYMGNLKRLKFMGEISSANRIKAQSLKPMYKNNIQTSSKQILNNFQTIQPNKYFHEYQAIKALQRNSSNGEKYCVLSNQVETNKSDASSLVDEAKRIENQSNEEWLSKYNNWEITQC